MPYSAKILKDSIAPCGFRLTTWELTYPRMVHAELMTHRVFSRNAASSRAIPNEKLRKRVQDDPAMPVWWGKNQAGMAAREELSNETDYSQKSCGRHSVDGYNSPRDRCDDCQSQLKYGFSSPMELAKAKWLEARDLMLRASEDLAKLGLHKQLCNRLIEPWMYITVIVSATTFDNWFHLRNHKDAQPEIAKIANMMEPMYIESVPEQVPAGMWHLPLIDFSDLRTATVLCGGNGNEAALADPTKSQVLQVLGILKKVSVGRCARVSYLTHDGKRDLMEDIKLHDRLIAGMETGEPLHLSPFEHVAEALEKPERVGNYTGWRQYRKQILPSDTR